MTKTIYIAGMGLIGASLGLGIKRDHPDYQIFGYNRSQESLDVALERGCIDRGTTDFASFALQADVIVLAVPIKQTIAFMEELSQLDLKDGVIITDVGSTKSDIVKAGEQFFSGKSIRFIGGHPMAGSHKTGAVSADVNLFENAYYIFTPSQLTDETTLSEMKEILSGLHARYIEVDPIEHDLVTSQISHFPHILASGLMEQAGAFAQDHPLTQHFAAGGFRDMTRIAESEPGMWTSIVMTNKAAVRERLEDFKHRLDEMIAKIDAEDEDGVWNFFDYGRKTRQQMEIHKRGGVDSFFDIFVDVPDEADVILRILELLRGTSLVNIRINEENREDISGILQISFKHQADQERSAKIIQENTTYPVYLD